MKFRNRKPELRFSSGLYLIAVLAMATQLCLAPRTSAQIEVTENFDLGTGTRFDLFLNNVVVRPKPLTMSDPADNTVIDDAFGGTRTVVDDEGNIVTNFFGFTTTSNAGGMGAGELGGEFNWFDPGAIADTNIGGDMNLSHEVRIAATARMDDIGLENDQTVTLAYFSLPENPVASNFGRGNVVAGISFTGGARFQLTINGNRSDPISIPGGYDDDTGQTDVFDIDLTLKFDPNLGTNGLAWFEGVVAGIPINNLTYTREGDIGDTFNSFAVAQTFFRESQDALRRGVGWIDDLTYSVLSDGGIDVPNPTRIDIVIPEPASVVLLCTALASMFAYRRRNCN